MSVLVLKKADKPAAGTSKDEQRKVSKVKDIDESTPVKTDVHEDKALEIAQGSITTCANPIEDKRIIKSNCTDVLHKVSSPAKSPNFSSREIS